MTDIIAEQKQAIRKLRVQLKDAAARVDLPSVSYYRMLIDKKAMMVECLKKGREEVK